MYTLLETDGTHLSRSKLEDMNFHHLKWLDLLDPTPTEIGQVAEIVGLSKKELESALDRNELPRLTELNHFLLLITKAPFLHSHQSRIASTSVAFMLSEKLLITAHKDPVSSIHALLEGSDEELSSRISKGTDFLLCDISEEITKCFLSTLEDLEDQIDKIEDSVFSNPDQKAVKKIFSLKRTLIYFHKGLSSNRDVLITAQKIVDERLDTRVQNRLTALYYDTIQLIDSVATYRDILTGTLDIYLSAVSNNMNAVMKKMAAYGTIVLVPTFITGLYGMNFQVLPETTWKYGYLFAWGLIIASVFVLWVYFKKMDWF